MPTCRRTVGADPQVFLDAQAREQPAVLWYMRDAMLDDAVRWQPGQRAAFQGHIAGERGEQARDGAHQRRLAGAVWTNDADRFAGPDIERDVAERAKRAVAG